MTCYNPLHAYYYYCDAEKKHVTTFKFPKGKAYDYVNLPCGGCTGCRLAYVRMWAVRCYHELQTTTGPSMFLTLTYNEDSLPENYTLRKSDYQNFFKRLRKKISPKKFKYYLCGEYGENLSRPHYHAIIFGYCPTDLYPVIEDYKKTLYTSPSLEKIWGYGYLSIGAVTYDSCAYVAGYMMKKLKGASLHQKQQHYAYLNPITGELVPRLPEFSAVSNGIGLNYYHQYKDEIYNNDSVIFKTFEITPPRYYDTKLDLDDPLYLEQIKFDRKEKMLHTVARCTQEREHYDVLADGEKVLSAKLNLKTRGKLQ